MTQLLFFIFRPLFESIFKGYLLSSKERQFKLDLSHTPPQASQQREIFTIGLILAAGGTFFRRFDDLGYLAESFIPHNETESLKPDIPFPDMAMAIDSRTHLFKGIIQVEKVQFLQSYRVLNGLDHPFVCLSTPQVISRRKDVAGIDTQS